MRESWKKANSTFNSVQPTKKFTKWLMKSEPESRFEKGVDVKVW
jgi:hypothetical protein